MVRGVIGNSQKVYWDGAKDIPLEYDAWIVVVIVEAHVVAHV